MEQPITISDALVKFFIQNGINTIFGVVGDAVFPFFDALGKQKDIKYYGTSHEVNAAFMASYHAKLTGKAGVCTATSGPGTANLVNGLADAYFDRAPVLAITGQVDIKKIGTNAKQYINQQTLLEAVTKSSEMVTSAESVLPIISTALTRAVNEHTVTHVSIPVDLFSQEVLNPVLPTVSSFASGKWGSGFAEELEEALVFLQASKAPVVVIGEGKQEWREILLKLVDQLGAGIIIGQQAKGVISDSYPLVVGGIGEAFVPRFLKETDLILLIGSSTFEDKFFPSDAKVIQIVAEPAELNFSLLTKGIAGEIPQIIKILSERITKKNNPDWKEKVAQDKQNLINLVQSQEQNKAAPIHPAHLMTVLKKVLPEDAVIVCDVGGFIHWFDTYFQAENQRVLISTHWRSMGGGLPGALSACLAEKQKKVIALVGDGGFLMSLGELATAVKYALPVTVVVANNHQYNLEKSKMEVKGLKPFGYNIKVPDFAMLAKAFGADGKSVSDPQQLESVLLEGLTSEKPFVVDVNLDQISLPLLK